MQLLFAAVDHRNYRNGDCIAILDDGKSLGRDEDPATSTNGLWVVVNLPAGQSNRGRLRYLTQREIDPFVPWIITPRPGHPDGDSRVPNAISPRRYSLDPQMLPPGLRAQWLPGRRITLGSETALENVIRDRENGNQPIDPGTVPRD